MNVKNLKPIAQFTLVFFLLSNTACSGVQSNEAQLSQDTKQNTIDEISSILSSNYVYPETAEKMNSLVKSKLEKGAYNTINDYSVFSQQLTEDLQSISKDKHLRVWNNNGEILAKRRRGGKFQSNVNYGFYEVKMLTKKIGYIDLRSFSGSSIATTIAEHAMKQVSKSETIIIDLRKNSGGSPEMIRTLTSYFFDGKERVHLNTFYWRPNNSYQEFHTSTEINGKRMDKVEIYLLISENTFSAAEEFVYNLKHLKRATLVGETTGGGAHPGGSQAINQYFSMFIPQGRAINPITNTNWEGTGVTPDIEVKAENALESVLDLLKKK